MVKFGETEMVPLTAEEKDKFRAMAKDALAPRAKLLAGGAPGIDVADEIVKEMDMIILYYQPSNVMLVRSPEGNLVPDCWSWDAITPDAVSTNKQADTCAKCPANTFGSADEGRGKKCKNSIRTFIIPAGKRMPILFSVPPTSYKEFQILLGKLLYHGVMYDRAVIHLDTKVISKTTAKGVFPVTTAQFTIVGQLDGDVSWVDNLKAEVIPALNRRSEGATELAKEVLTTNTESHEAIEEDDALPA
jgi:hypothetical protein